MKAKKGMPEIQASLHEIIGKEVNHTKNRITHSSVREGARSTLFHHQSGRKTGAAVAEGLSLRRTNS